MRSVNLKLFSFAILFLTVVFTSCKGLNKKKMEKLIEKSYLEVIVGTYTKSESEGIYKLTINTETGALLHKTLLVDSNNPSYLAISNDQKYVYAVQENEKGEIVGYKWNEDNTKLIEISRLTTKGMHPCYISLNEDNSLLSIGNYSSGDIAVYKVLKDGVLHDSIQTRKHLGKGTLLPRQSSPHAHCTKFYKNNFLYAVDLGIDKVVSYSIKNGDLKTSKVALKTDDGDGPRHLTFHPTKNISYVTTEFTNSIIVARVNVITGDFNSIQKISMLPTSSSKESFAADIHVSNDGKFLYASNRGHNSIATFSIDNEGKLTLINHISTEGNWPRNFALSKDNKFLLVANQLSNNIVVFKRDEKLGTLTKTQHKIEMSSPVFLKFL